jgi:hypothetical protein
MRTQRYSRLTVRDIDLAAELHAYPLDCWVSKENGIFVYLLPCGFWLAF